MNQSDVTNKSGITPVGHRVLLKPEEVQKVSAGGIIIPQAAQEKEEMAQMYGRVVEIGPEAWKESREKGYPAWVKSGDRVIFGKYSGLVFPGHDGTTYRLINDRDIVAVVAELERK